MKNLLRYVKQHLWYSEYMITNAITTH